MCGLDPCMRTGPKKALNAFMPKTANHDAIVARGATRRKRFER